MVKGITRQVILVKSPDPRLFEEAIFIVKEEALAREGVTAERVLKEARRAADGYLKQGLAWNRRLERLPAPLWAAIGAAAASAGWLGLFFTKHVNSYASVYVKEKQVLRIDLSKNKSYVVNGKLGKVHIEVKQKKVRVTQEKSLHHYCSKQGFVSDANVPIVCLPNETVVKIEKEASQDTVIQ